MTTSPFVRIRNKNIEIKALKDTVTNVATVLKCQPTETEIIVAINEQRRLIGNLIAMEVENEKMKKEMVSMVAEKVERETFNLNLEKLKLEDKVAKLEKLLDNKEYKINDQKQIIIGNKKGFWDFVYKIFNLT